MGGGASLVLGTTVPWGRGGGGGMPAIFSLSLQQEAVATMLLLVGPTHGHRKG